MRDDVCVCVQDKTKEKSSRFDTLRHSLAGMIRSPKTMLGSSTSVRFVLKLPQLVVASVHKRNLVPSLFVSLCFVAPCSSSLTSSRRQSALWRSKSGITVLFLEPRLKSYCDNRVTSW